MCYFSGKTVIIAQNAMQIHTRRVKLVSTWKKKDHYAKSDDVRPHFYFDTQPFKSAQQSFDLVNPDCSARCVCARASYLQDIIRYGAL